MRAFIFDLDGTMVDNMMVHHFAWQKTLASLGMPLKLQEVMKKVHGINEEILERLFGDQLTPEERKIKSFEKEEAYRLTFKDRLALIPGLHDFLMEARSAHIPMAIASAAPPENVDFVLDNLQIRDFFNPIFHSDSVKKGKPDPEIYLKTADTIGLHPEDCLVFEDSPTGAKAAATAGCPIVILNTTHEVDEFDHIDGIVHFMKNYKELSINNFLEIEINE